MKTQKALNIKLARINGKTIGHVRCFWTPPLGHIWGRHPTDSSYYRKCVICGTESNKGNYDGGWFRDLAHEGYEKYPYRKEQL